MKPVFLQFTACILMSVSYVMAALYSEAAELASREAGDKYLTLAPGIPIPNPPQEVAANAPTDADFTKLFADFFEGAFLNVAKPNKIKALADHFAKENANDLYIRLKNRERSFHGSVYVDGTQFQGEDKILVSARIAYADQKKKYLITEIVHINFIHKGGFKDVKMAIATMQEMPKT
jgi:hypothetical protein